MKDKAYILRIINYASKIAKYMKNVETYESFKLNDEKVDAVILNLEQIGETAKKLSIEAKNAYPNIKWPNIIGLRNMISHEYEGVNTLIIFEIVNKDIPNLLNTLSNSTSVNF